MNVTTCRNAVFLCFYHLKSLTFGLDTENLFCSETKMCNIFYVQVVEAFGNRSGQDSLFELLFGPQVSTATSFIANDDIHAINAVAPDLVQLAKWDSGMMK